MNTTRTVWASSDSLLNSYYEFEFHTIVFPLGHDTQGIMGLPGKSLFVTGRSGKVVEFWEGPQSSRYHPRVALPSRQSPLNCSKNARIEWMTSTKFFWQQSVLVTFKAAAALVMHSRWVVKTPLYTLPYLLSTCTQSPAFSKRSNCFVLLVRIEWALV